MRDARFTDIPPDVIEELAPAHDARHQRAARYANPDRYRISVLVAKARGDPEHVESEARQSLRVVRAFDGNATDNHVAVASRLDLFQPVLLDELVERREHTIEQLDHLKWETSDWPLS